MYMEINEEKNNEHLNAIMDAIHEYYEIINNGNLTALENAIHEYYKNIYNDKILYGVYSALAEAIIFLPTKDDEKLLSSLSIDDQEIIPIFSRENQIPDNEHIQIVMERMEECIDTLIMAQKQIIINPFDKEGMSFLLSNEIIEELIMPIILQKRSDEVWKIGKPSLTIMANHHFPLLFSEGFQSIYFDILEYGDFFGNILEITINDDESCVQSIELVSLSSVVIQAKPDIEFSHNTEFMFSPDITRDKCDRNFNRDFTMYFDRDDIVFVIESDLPVKYVCANMERMEIGTDKDGHLRYFKIKRLTEEEYNQLVDMLNEVGVYIYNKDK